MTDHAPFDIETLEASLMDITADGKDWLSKVVKIEGEEHYFVCTDLGRGDTVCDVYSGGEDDAVLLAMAPNLVRECIRLLKRLKELEHRLREHGCFLCDKAFEIGETYQRVDLGDAHPKCVREAKKSEVKA